MNSDVNAIFPDIGNIEVWGEISQKVIALAEKSTDRNIKGILVGARSEDKGIRNVLHFEIKYKLFFSLVVTQVAALKLLPYMLPNTAVKSSKDTKAIRPSKLEVATSFFEHFFEVSFI